MGCSALFMSVGINKRLLPVISCCADLVEGHIHNAFDDDVAFGVNRDVTVGTVGGA